MALRLKDPNPGTASARSDSLRASDSDYRAGSPTRIVLVLAFAGIVVSLMQSLVISLVPKLPALLIAPAGDTTWAITATLYRWALAHAR